MSSTKNEKTKETYDDFYLIEDDSDVNFIENGRNFLNYVDSIEELQDKKEHINEKTGLGLPTLKSKFDSDTNHSFVGIDSSTLFSQEHFNFGTLKKNTSTEVIDSNNTQKTGASCNKEADTAISKEKVIYKLKRNNRLCLNKIEDLTRDNLVLKAQIEELKNGQAGLLALPSNSLSVATLKPTTPENQLAITNQS